MGTSTSAVAFAQKIAACGEALAAAERDGVAAAALIMKRTIEASRDRAVGGDGRMSHVGSAPGAKLGVGYEISRKGNGETWALMKARGPWQLIEFDTGAHRIGVRRRARRGGSRKSAIHFGSLFRASVQHPGTSGKHPFRLGIAAGEPLAVLAIRRSTTNAVSGVIKGNVRSASGSSGSRLKGRSDD